MGMSRRIGKVLAEVRKDLDMTQAEVANQIGLKDFATVSYWENGKRLAGHIKFLKMLRLYGLAVEEVLIRQTEGEGEV